MRRGTNPDAAEADLQACYIGKFVTKDLARIKSTVAVAILEDEAAIAPFGAFRQPVRIRQALRDPKPAPVVERERDRLHQIRLTGEQGHLETGRHGHELGGLGRGKGFGMGRSWLAIRAWRWL